MGIKHFFTWFRNNEEMKQAIYNEPPRYIDHILIDMNGIIHESAQFVFKYGKYSSKIQIPARFKNKSKAPAIENLYSKIHEKVNEIIQTVNPQKSIYLAIDGVAPKSKQNQQRQRRFRAAMENNQNILKTEPIPLSSSNDHSQLRKYCSSSIGQFDSNCITAGTKFMHDLSLSLIDLSWVKFPNKKIDVKISTDSEPGEGEHKLINWIRQNICQSNNDDVYCVAGVDADLILLCCLLKTNNIFIMRESEYVTHYIDIALAQKLLPISADDLLMLSCFIGNDFLPPIPSLEIKESAPELGALDYFFGLFEKYFPKYYCQICPKNSRFSSPLDPFKTRFEEPHSAALFERYSLLVNKKNGHINFKALKFIFQKISEREQDIMKARHLDKERFINEMWKGNINDYRIAYYDNKLQKADKDTIVISYLKSAQWVYEYYSKGIPSWDWYYPYNYTLHANDFVEYCPLNVLKFSFRMSEPSHPHEQLLRVIPPLNKHLIPFYLHDEFEKISKKSNTFKIDKTGKREEWEAVTIVDFVELDSKIIYESK
jgi:5'-3' exonuclease